MKKKDKLIDKAQKYIQKGYLDKAIAEYQKAVDLDRSDTAIRLRLGELYIKAGMNENAIEQYAEVAKVNTHKGFYLKSIAVYKQILKLDESSLDVHYKLADLYTRQRLIADAISEYSYIVSTFEKKGRTNDVLDLIKKMVEIDPENVGVRLKLADMYQKLDFDKDALNEYSWILGRLVRDGKLDKAEKIYLGLLEASPGEPVVLEGLAEIYKNKGDNEKYLEYAKSLAGSYKLAGELEKAKALYQTVVEINPADKEAKKFLGGIKVEEPKEELSKETAVKESAEQKPKHAPPRPSPEKIKEVETEVEPGVEETPETPAGEELITWPEDSIEVEGPDAAKEEEPPIEPIREELEPESIEKVVEEEKADVELIEPPEEQAGAELIEAVKDEAGPGEVPLEEALCQDVIEKVEEEPEPSGEVDLELETGTSAIEEVFKEAAEPAEPEIIEETIEEEPAVEAVEEVLEQEAAPEEKETIEEQIAPETIEEVIQEEAEPAPVEQSTEEQPSTEMVEEVFREGASTTVEEPVEVQQAVEAAEEVLQPAPEAEPTQEPLEEKTVQDIVERVEEEAIEAGPEAERPVEEILPEAAERVEEEVAGEVKEDIAHETVSEAPKEEPVLEPAEESVEEQFAAESMESSVEEEPGAEPEEEPFEIEHAPELNERVEEEAIEAGSEAERPVEEVLPEAAERVEEDVAGEIKEDIAHETVSEAPKEEPVPEPAEESIEEQHGHETLEEVIREEAETGPAEAAGEEESVPETAERVEEAPGPEPQASEASIGEQPVPESVKEFIEEVRSETGNAFEEHDVPVVAEKVLDVEADLGTGHEQVEEVSFKPDEMIENVEADEHVETFPGAGETEEADEGKNEYVDLGAELGLEEALDTMAGSWAEGEAKETVEEFKNGIGKQLSKEDTETHYNLGIAYMEMELYKEAEREFKLALKDPRLEFNCYTRLGVCAMTDNDPDQAIEYYLRALKVEGHSEDERKGLMYELALACEEAGNSEEAGKFFWIIYGMDREFREVSSKIKDYPEQSTGLPIDDGLVEVELL